MTYQIEVDSIPFVASSCLGFEAENRINLHKEFRIVDIDFASQDETWTQPWGENKTIRNHYNEMAVHLSDAAATKLILRFRVFDDGGRIPLRI